MQIKVFDMSVPSRAQGSSIQVKLMNTLGETLNRLPSKLAWRLLTLRLPFSISEV